MRSSIRFSALAHEGLIAAGADGMVDESPMG
jgi:hypothetical protein